MQWSAAARSVWGKLDPSTVSWLPLVTHLEHCAAVAGILFDEFLPGAVRRYLADALGVSSDELRALCTWLAGVHDVGKASPSFARKADAVMPSVSAQMHRAGLQWGALPHREKSLGHGTIGQFAVAEWLKATYGSPQRAATTWAGIVGGHHGRNPTELDLESARLRPDAVGRDPCGLVRCEILDTMARATGVDDHLAGWTRKVMPIPAQVLLTAIVIVTDWIASNQDFFPYVDDRSPAARAHAALEQLTLPSAWNPAVPTADADSLLVARFPSLAKFGARPIQRALVHAAFTCDTPPLHIVEAPMGIGKTEAAFLAAEIIAARFGQGGVYIGLPTMATANPMFDRALDWLGSALGQKDASVTLAHGKAGLNDRFTGLLREPHRGHVYDVDDDVSAGQPVVNGWLRGRKKAGLASFVTGTVDQGLFGALKAKHVVLRLLGLSGKVVVIDECHAADTYMREYLKRLLSWLGALHTPVILMSATLPPDQRDEYVAAYARGRGDREPGATDRTDTYPRITQYDGSLRSVPVPAAEAGQDVHLRTLSDDTEVLADLFGDKLAAGGCAAVICNTVARAQEAYRALQAKFGDDVVLLHSRLIAPDRAVREQRLVRVLGRDDSARPDRLIVVGTQVLEQSLDVDFDLMVTDVAPMDLLLQRVGRLHRHSREQRPDAVAHPCLYLRGVADWGAVPPTPVAGSRAVYGLAPLLRSLALLAGRSSFKLPHDIPTLVRIAYERAFPCPPGWEREWATAETDALGAGEAARQRASTYLLTEPWQPENLNNFIDVQAQDPDRSEEQGRSQVRDSEDSLEVIALWRLDGQLRLPECSPAFAGALIPEGIEWGSGSDSAVARAMAACTLSLPAQLTNRGVIDEVIGALERTVDYSGWQKSSWVAGQLVVAFDSADRARLAGFELHYSFNEGLIVTRTEERI